MAEQVTELIAEYGLEAVCIALCVNFLTAVIKLPVKALAKRTSNGARITRFIVFLPIILAFAISFAYLRFIIGQFTFNKEFITLWFTSASLSLTFYAIFEKLVPPKQKTDAKAEINNTEDGNDDNGDKTAHTEANAVAPQKIIIGRKRDENSEIEK